MHQFVKVFIVLLFLVVVASLPTESYFSDVELDNSIDSEDRELKIIDASILKTVKVLVEELNKNIRYTFGRRLKNDRLISHNSDSNLWNTPQNVTLILQYPGGSSTITYVEIDVRQSFDLGSARILAGGIGKHSIAVVVEANSTFWLSYTANIYGI